MTSKVCMTSNSMVSTSCCQYLRYEIKKICDVKKYDMTSKVHHDIKTFGCISNVNAFVLGLFWH